VRHGQGRGTARVFGQPAGPTELGCSGGPAVQGRGATDGGDRGYRPPSSTGPLLTGRVDAHGNASGAVQGHFAAHLAD